MGEWHGEVLLGLLLLGGLYAGAARAAGQPLVSARALAMAGALVLLAGTLNGPLHDLSDRYLFSAHMVQHLILTLIAPPLLLMSLTPPMLAPVLRYARLTAALRRLTRPPVTFVLYNAVLVVWHLPGPYHAALEWHPLHIVQHLSLIATAVLVWWPILSRVPELPPASYPIQILYLFLLGIPMSAIAALVTMADVPLYPFYAAAPRIWDMSPLEDQRLGGLIMWVPGSIAPLVAFTAVFFRWAQEDT